MKIGDKVRSTKIRPDDVATVVKVNIVRKEKELRTSYVADFDDGTSMTFYGFNINKTIHKVDEDYEQLRLDQFMDMSV